ncbi:MAG TPA: PH domain-containing protein, partial [Candidatus Micrarchaeota archaeon]|nr:PH domain-containing protein [Candidatus Micrarchaeota archaeon]
PSAYAILAGPLLALPFFLAWAAEIIFIRKTFRFSLQKGFLFVRSGSINPNYEIVPYENVQDAQVSQGIFERIFGIANVYVSTPAGTVPVFGIKLESAQEFRKDLLALAKMHRGMAE